MCVGLGLKAAYGRSFTRGNDTEIPISVFLGMDEMALIL
jgi:hypothetical protein